MASYIGQLGPYEKGTNFSEYLERFEYFILANAVDAKLKKATFF